MTLLEAVCKNFGYDPFAANGYIMAGKVLVNDEVCSYPSTKVKESARIRIREKNKKFVTRAGNKLEAALKYFGLDVSGMTALDLGASEGGFVDCLLKRNAGKIYAVDVAYGIFNYSLRSNSKVVLLERTNAKYLTEKEIPEPIDLITTDVSFISLTAVVTPALQFLKDGGYSVLLFKPQFELSKELLGKNGIPLRKSDITARIREVSGELHEKGLSVYGIAQSPVRGNSGNTEYLLIARKDREAVITDSDIESCVLSGQLVCRRDAADSDG